MLLLTVIILGGMTWADTLDLSDDIPLSLSLAVVQQAIEPDERNFEHLLDLVQDGQAVAFLTPCIPQSRMPAVSGARFVFLQSDLSLYRRFSTYRI